jgi:very-short-patch-repair endonuclease
MTERLHLAFSSARQGLATRAHLRAAGIKRDTVTALVARGEIVRVRRGVYARDPLAERGRHLVSGGLPDRAYLAEVRAALMSLGATAVAGGRTAAVIWSMDMLVEPARVELVAPASRGARPRQGITIERRRWSTAVQRRALGLAPVRVLTPEHTVVDCVVQRPLREGVVILDSALRRGLVTAEGLERALDEPALRRFGPRVRRALDLADPDSGSVLESALRLLLAQHGLYPESQVALRDATGSFIGRVDFLFRDERLVVECDGRRWHDPQDARERDRVRDNELERAAYRLIRVTWSDVVHRPEHVIALVRDCLAPWPLAA